eukprot:c14865_g1_i2.p1 GENE.c14865_g1_i2~~c14865_g1_i2.p1  ORF type:complete len:248 (+),score=80.07 c14865_g1_i2:25-768(+)
MTELVLDPCIRDWVLIPIVLVMFFVGLLRHYITLLVKGEPKPDGEALLFRQIMTRSEWLKRNGNEIPEEAFLMRKQYFCEKEKGTLVQGKKTEAVSPLQDPNMMAEMMKNNVTMIITQMGMMGVVSTFFSGFIVVKLPFPLSERFKVMLQRGVELNSLHVTYVSSLSWYFINLFGLRGLFSLVLGEDNETDDTKMMQSQMTGGQMQPGQDTSKIMQQQAESLEVVNHVWVHTKIEERIINELGSLGK